MNVYYDEIFLGFYENDPEEELLKYTLSNNLDEIEKVIECNIINRFPKLEETDWKLNTDKLAKKVKDMMNKWDVNYSMTIHPDRNEKNINYVAVNWRKDNNWMFYGGVIIAKEFFSYKEVRSVLV